MFLSFFGAKGLAGTHNHTAVCVPSRLLLRCLEKAAGQVKREIRTESAGSSREPSTDAGKCNGRGGEGTLKLQQSILHSFASEREVAMLLRKAHRSLYCLHPRSSVLLSRRTFVLGSRGVHDEPRLVKVAPAVRRALEEGRPVVALESTIISHGMPYPENLAMAR